MDIVTTMILLMQLKNKRKRSIFLRKVSCKALKDSLPRIKKMEDLITQNSMELLVPFSMEFMTISIWMNKPTKPKTQECTGMDHVLKLNIM